MIHYNLSDWTILIAQNPFMFTSIDLEWVHQVSIYFFNWLEHYSTLLYSDHQKAIEI